MRSRRKNTRSSSGRASRGDTGSWLHCWASQSRYFLCRSSMIRLLRGESGPWNWLEGAFCPNRLNLYRLIYHGRTWIGIPGQAPRVGLSSHGSPAKDGPKSKCLARVKIARTSAGPPSLTISDPSRFLPPGEDRSDVGGAAQFNNIGPVPLSPPLSPSPISDPSRFLLSSRFLLLNNIGPVPLSPRNIG